MSTQVTAFDQLDMACIAAGTVAAEVRQRIALRLADWRLTHLADDVQLVAAELITNACAITPQGQIRVRFTRETKGVLLAVWDSSHQMPRVQPVAELDLDDLDLSEQNFDRNGGWGLQLVTALSTECGVSRTDPQGKWVWSRFSV